MLDKIQSAARQAGEIMLSFRDAAAHEKAGHYNFYTDADVAVQRSLQDALLSLLPGARFFAEEQENDPLTDETTFVVDPIDGTANFVRHRNQSVVSIALLENKQPVLGVVYNPYVREMFTAEKGKGAYLNGTRLQVSSMPLENALVAFGTSPYDVDLAPWTIQAAAAFLRAAGDLRRTGSSAVDLCDLACGRADVFFELRLRPWDFAAGSLIVQEAGGLFRSLGYGAPYYEGPAGVLAANPLCMAAAEKLLWEAKP